MIVPIQQVKLHDYEQQLKKRIIAFEEIIFNLYSAGVIKYPVHLRSGHEDDLIVSLRSMKEDDWLFGYWDSHALALIKKVPEEKIKTEIMAGNSISLMLPEYRLYCSGIVGSLFGVAVGVAWSIKKKGVNEKVFCYCGDMSAETGIFHEAVKYAYNFDLPIKWIVGDNGLSVLTPTRKVWGSDEPWFVGTKYEKNIYYFKYKSKYPHSGIGRKVAF